MILDKQEEDQQHPQPIQSIIPDLNNNKIGSEIIFTSETIIDHDIVYKRGYFVNSRGFKLVTQEWIPKNPIGSVIILHGYGDHTQTFFAEDAKKFAEWGMAVFAFDQQGHGLSEGTPAYIRDFEDLMDDSILFIDNIIPRFPNLKRFIYCISMGGAVALLVSLKRPEIFNGGLILLSPLITLDDSMMPNPLVVNILTWISILFPELAIVPGENILHKSIKDPQKRFEYSEHPLTYKGKTRLGTGLAVMKVTDFLKTRLTQVQVPLLILHGSLDRVSSPVSSQNLYEAASSLDKTIKIYEGMWHSLTCEPEAEIVYNDIQQWIENRLHTNTFISITNPNNQPQLPQNPKDQI
eukprot:gene6794-8430_t